MFCDVSISNPYAPETIFELGEYYIKYEEQSQTITCTLTALEFGKTDEVSARDYIDAYTLVESTKQGAYYQRKLDINDDGTFTLPNDQKIRLCAKPYGLAFKSINPDKYIQTDNFTLASLDSKNPKIQIQLPTYT